MQATEQAREPPARLVVSHRDAHGLILSNHHEQALGVRNTVVDQIALEQHEELHGHRNYDATAKKQGR
jgi:hypothetical protein